MVSIEVRLGRWIARFAVSREAPAAEEDAGVVLGTITHLADEEDLLVFGFTG